MIKDVKMNRFLKKILFLIILIECILIIIFLIKNNILKKNKVIYTLNDNKSDKYKILVDVEESKLYLFNNEELIKTYRCSGGKVYTPSPIGTWKIISKAKWGEGFRRKFFRD